VALPAKPIAAAKTELPYKQHPPPPSSTAQVERRDSEPPRRKIQTDLLPSNGKHSKILRTHELFDEKQLNTPLNDPSEFNEALRNPPATRMLYRSKP
jgi:hypothetical protein